MLHVWVLGNDGRAVKFVRRVFDTNAKTYRNAILAKGVPGMQAVTRGRGGG